MAVPRHLLYCFFALSRFVSFYIAQKNDTLFFSVAFRPDLLYTNILGVARDLFFRFPGVESLKKTLGAGPSMRFFGFGSSRLRFVASRSYINIRIAISVCNIRIAISV